MEFQRVPLKFHTKYLTHTLVFIQCWNFLRAIRCKSSYMFLKSPPGDTFKCTSLSIIVFSFTQISFKYNNRISDDYMLIMSICDIFMWDYHDDVIKWKHFPRYWPFVWGIHRSTVNSLHKGQWRGALMFSLICVWINCWVNNREAGDLRCHRTHYDVTIVVTKILEH